MFVDLYSPPLFPSLLITTLIYCCRISHTLSASSCPSPPFLLSLSLPSSPISHQPVKLSLQTCPLTAQLTQPLFCFVFSSSSDSCVSTCNAVCASGTTASSHLKRFRETHICCFRTQRDMPWQRLFEVASQGEPEPERGISGTIKKR